LAVVSRKKAGQGRRSIGTWRILSESTSEIIGTPTFEPREFEASKRLAANLPRQPAQNKTAFELGLPRERPVISGKKPTAQNDDGLVRKNTRGDRTPSELFLADVHSLPADLIRAAKALATIDPAHQDT
jgi:hypothetical protein